MKTRSRFGVLCLLCASLSTAACLGSMDDEQSSSASSSSKLSADSMTLVRKGSGKCLDVNGAGKTDGTKIQQWTCNGTAAQDWVLDDRGGGVFRLLNPNSGKCAALASSSNANGTGIQLASCTTSSAQKFKVESASGGLSHLVNTRSGKCLDVNGASSADGAKVQIWSCNNSDAQSWQQKSGASGDGDGDGDAAGDGDTTGGDNLTWRQANLTNFTSYPDPGSEECIEFSGCEYEGEFAFVDGTQSEAWVKAHNIAAVHSRDANKYKLKTLRLKKNEHVIDVTVYDECADSDCDGCCTQNANAHGVGFLIDIESYTAQRFGVDDGIIDWACLNCN
jgi:hypothetical protein